MTRTSDLEDRLEKLETENGDGDSERSDTLAEAIKRAVNEEENDT